MDAERMNVLLVVLEGARADRIGCYGYERETTPFLDQVAREGVRFTRAFTCATASLPAHAAILTGLFAAGHGATEESGTLGDRVPVLPERLAAAGYRTAAFCSDPRVAPETGFGRGFERYYTARPGSRLTGRAADYARRASDRVLGRTDAGARRVNQALLDWLDHRRSPFFGYVVYREPVWPASTPAPYDRMFATANGTAGADATASADGALRYVDMRLKEIADRLHATGQWDQTVLVVTSTHGHQPAASGWSVLADDILHVPLLVRAPRRTPRGFVVDEMAQLTDLAPTILALTGVAAPQPMGQGRALLDEHGATPGPGFVVAETYRNPADPSAVRRKIIRTRREKFGWQSDEANALFDLWRDPSEQHNLIADETARADGLRRRLFDWLAASEQWAAEHGLDAALGASGAARGQQGGRE